MSTPINNIIRGGSQAKSLFTSALPVLSSAVTYNQGDLIAFNTSTKVLKVAATGDGANILGVAVNTVVSGLPKSPYQGTAVDASQGASDMEGPVYGVVASLYLTSGDAFVLGAPVYLTADPQTVTVTQPGSDPSIGVFVGQAAITPAASGTKGDIQIGLRYGVGGGILF
ncbi:MAG: hypothetical protein KW793_04375 [Candidatus Doudnabacteria bacterium]|nr:hypothetical protein [Candidatus Doudnabacteria bacterium]